MKMILQLALRNLFRQKRRSVLLGAAIVFGAGILVVVNSFAAGITKVLFEQVVKYVNGHVAISFMKNGNMMSSIFYDGDRIYAAIKKAAPENARADEAIGVFARALGNGTADNVILVGADMYPKGTVSAKELAEYRANFKMLDGPGFEGLKDKSHGIPVLVSNEKAKTLKVKCGDILRIRFTGVTNQSSSAKLVIVGVFKPANMFMSMPIFLEIHDLRTLLGYGTHEIPSLHLNMDHPEKNAKKVADQIYAELTPGTAVIEGTATGRGPLMPVMMVGYKNDSAARKQLAGLIAKGQTGAPVFTNDGVVASAALARICGIKAGDTVTVSWSGKFDSAKGVTRLAVTAIADSASPITGNLLYVNDREFYRWYYMPLPKAPSSQALDVLNRPATSLSTLLVPEFTLMKRCATTDEYTKALAEMTQQRVRGVVVSVQSMYETASAIISVEHALSLISLVAGVVLFLIILIGVVNTLRMTIRERTREIGAIRAIGMQRGDVLSLFVAESVLLSLLSTIAGTICAFGAMKLLSLITIDASENPLGMILVNSHLFFAPNPFMIVSFIVIIAGITALTAYFPARRASRISAANAMRHYE